MTQRYLLVDDNRGFLEAARDLLEREGIEVVGVASTSAETLRLVAQLHPDVVVVDVDLGEESGFDLASRLATGTAVTRIVLISAYPEAEFADLVAASGAVGFVSKAELSAQAVSNLLGGGGDVRRGRAN
jgi:two-component system, NarL family, nitrate/nitrite response regulator NarL